MRVEVGVRLSHGGSVRAQAYMYQRPLLGVRRIESGDWLESGGSGVVAD